MMMGPLTRRCERLAMPDSEYVNGAGSMNGGATFGNPIGLDGVVRGELSALSSSYGCIGRRSACAAVTRPQEPARSHRLPTPTSNPLFARLLRSNCLNNSFDGKTVGIAFD
jgi:hypothetical protein